MGAGCSRVSAQQRQPLRPLLRSVRRAHFGIRVLVLSSCAWCRRRIDCGDAGPDLQGSPLRLLRPAFLLAVWLAELPRAVCALVRVLRCGVPRRRRRRLLGVEATPMETRERPTHALRRARKGSTEGARLKPMQTARPFAPRPSPTTQTPLPVATRRLKHCSTTCNIRFILYIAALAFIFSTS